MKALAITLAIITTLAAKAQEQQDSIYLIHADDWVFNKAINPDAQILTGNVAFRHDSAFMYCDSALLYETDNSIEAFGNVRMEQGDTLFIYGKQLHYNGNTKLGRLRKDVKMINNNVTLLTDSLNYDRITNIGYYFNHGTIQDEENKLYSIYGKYSIDTKIANFNDSVKVENPKFTILSDTLNYNTDTKIATILGPSIIISDSGTIHSSKGWYDTTTGISLLLDRSQVLSGNRTLTGDSISYNKEQGYAEIFGNMILIDTTQMLTLKGNYGYYNEITAYAYATDSAIAMKYTHQKPDTFYIHADTIQMTTIDSTYRQIKAHYGVRFYRTDVQGVCDSMTYNTQDSILRMYNDPIIWNEANQISGDTIYIFINDTAADHAHIKQYAFSIQELSPTYYNQMKGNDMNAYFQGQTIRRIDVSGNAESIFYPIEKGEMTGMNRTQSPYITIWLKEEKLDKIKIWPNPTGTYTPIPDLHPEQKTLPDFHWYDYIKPTDQHDIFRKTERKQSEATPKRSNKFTH